MRLNAKHDSVFVSLNDFFSNDSLVFADTAFGKKYTFSAADIQIVYKTDTKKFIHHTPMRRNSIPKKVFEMVYETTKTNLAVMIYNISITQKASGKIIHSPNIAFKIIKKL